MKNRKLIISISLLGIILIIGFIIFPKETITIIDIPPIKQPGIIIP